MKCMPDRLLSLPRPLGCKGKSPAAAQRLCLRLTVPQTDGMVEYHAVLQDLIENSFFRSGAELDEQAFKGLPGMEGVVPAIDLAKLPPPNRVAMAAAEQRIAELQRRQEKGELTEEEAEELEGKQTWVKDAYE